MDAQDETNAASHSVAHVQLFELGDPDRASHAEHPIEGRRKGDRIEQHVSVGHPGVRREPGCERHRIAPSLRRQARLFPSALQLIVSNAPPPSPTPATSIVALVSSRSTTASAGLSGPGAGAARVMNAASDASSTTALTTGAGCLIP